MTPHLGGSVAAALAIIIGAFVSEDAATVTAASLAAASLLDVRISFLSAVAGLWVGDLGVYAAARWGKEKMPRRWSLKTMNFIQPVSSEAASDWPLALSRFFPGTRLPAYVSAGLNRVPFPRFAGITAVTATLWTAIVFVAIWIFPSQAQTAKERLAWLGVVGLTAFAGLSLWKVFGARLRMLLVHIWQRIVRWEFWPAWLFYGPVAAMCAWLGVRYRGLSLPTIANLNQKNGGIIGESKMERTAGQNRDLPRDAGDRISLCSKARHGTARRRLSQSAIARACQALSATGCATLGPANLCGRPPRGWNFLLSLPRRRARPNLRNHAQAISPCHRRWRSLASTTH